ncbi:MAG: HEAT repeat protein [Planctomycetota bacterium]|jgi:HEAT repeat protein
MLFDQNKEVRITAIETLSYFARQQSAPQVASLLTDANPEIRNHAVSALAEIGSTDSVLFLQQAQFDSDARVIANLNDVLAELARDAEADLNRE